MKRLRSRLWSGWLKISNTTNIFQIPAEFGRRKSQRSRGLSRAKFPVQSAATRDDRLAAAQNIAVGESSAMPSGYGDVIVIADDQVRAAVTAAVRWEHPCVLTGNAVLPGLVASTK